MSELGSSIVVYSYKGGPWQMCRYGGSERDMFFTATRKPSRFSDGRSAKGFKMRCERFAKESLGWGNVTFKRVNYYDFIRKDSDR